jgi:hypothetical protein
MPSGSRILLPVDDEFLRQDVQDLLVIRDRHGSGLDDAVGLGDFLFLDATIARVRLRMWLPAPRVTSVIRQSAISSTSSRHAGSTPSSPDVDDHALLQSARRLGAEGR